MKIKALAFVGIPVTDMKRARSFYEDVLGLKVSEEMMSGNQSSQKAVGHEHVSWICWELKLCLGFGNWDLELLEQQS
jgi:catechol 2,3-dioxygenase-like lactoylglutathione lyase family enzyme